MMNGQEGQPQNGPYYNVNAPAQQPPKRKSEPHALAEAQVETAGHKLTTDVVRGPQAKRNRYVSIACNECKRRKIRCNGETPCDRCGKLSLECVYAPNCCSSSFKDSEEYRQMANQIRDLQEQVNDLYAHLNAMRGGQTPYPVTANMSAGDPVSYRNALSPSRSRGSHSQFQGPTSSAYNFDVAKSSLQTMGIAEPHLPEEGGGVDIDPALGAPHQQQAPMAPMVTRAHKDPLWQLQKDEAIRLCKVYEEEMGMMYPMLNMDKTIAQTVTLFDIMDSARAANATQPELPVSDQLTGHDVHIVKMVIALGLMVEAYGQSELARAICDSCREAFESTLSRPVEIDGLILLVLVAEYNFQQDEEGQAYRLIGLAVRLSVEIGLHRRQNLFKNFANEEERSWVLKLFWSIYVLDRRWSFGTGMPFALQDSDIDPALPQPDDAHPYLSAMISYSRIASKVWQATITFESSGADIDRNRIGMLDYEILQWNNSIPSSLKFHPSDDFFNSIGSSRGHGRLQIILYQRTNLMRTQIYRPILHSATSIMENRDFAQTVVDVAKDTIKVLARLNETTDIYRTQQVCFNYFLIAALGVLFLAVAHAPMEFSRQVRDEFYLALDLVKGFSNRSYVAQRLWKTIRGLKEIAPKLGLISRQTKLTNANDPHSSAAVAMAGLAGHPVDEIAAYASAQKSSSLDSSPMNGPQLSYELTNLFEAAGGHIQHIGSNPQTIEGTNGFTSSSVNPVELPQGQEGYGGTYGHETDVSRIVDSLF